MSYWSKCDNNIKAIFSTSSCELTVYILLVEILESSRLTASNSSRFVRDQRTKLSFQSWVANANAYSNSCYRNEQSHLKVNCDDFQRHIKSAVRWKYRFIYIYADIFSFFLRTGKSLKIKLNSMSTDLWNYHDLCQNHSQNTFSTMYQIEFALYRIHFIHTNKRNDFPIKPSLPTFCDFRNTDNSIS